LLERGEREALKRDVHAGEKDGWVELFRRDLVALRTEDDVRVLADLRTEVLKQLHVQQSGARLVKSLPREAERHVPRHLVFRVDDKPPEEIDPAEFRAQDGHDERGKEAAVLARHLTENDGIVVLDAAELRGERLLLFWRQLHR